MHNVELSALARAGELAAGRLHSRAEPSPAAPSRTRMDNAELSALAHAGELAPLLAG